MRSCSAAATATAIFGADGPDANWPQYRTLALADSGERDRLRAPRSRSRRSCSPSSTRLPQGRRQAGRPALDEAVKLSAAQPPVQAEALVLRSAIRKDVKDKLADLDEAVYARRRHGLAARRRGSAANRASSTPPWKTSTASSSWT